MFWFISGVTLGSFAGGFGALNTLVRVVEAPARRFLAVLCWVAPAVAPGARLAGWQEGELQRLHEQEEPRELRQSARIDGFRAALVDSGAPSSAANPPTKSAMEAGRTTV